MILDAICFKEGKKSFQYLFMYIDKDTVSVTVLGGKVSWHLGAKEYHRVTQEIYWQGRTQVVVASAQVRSSRSQGLYRISWVEWVLLSRARIGGISGLFTLQGGPGSDHQCSQCVLWVEPGLGGPQRRGLPHVSPGDYIHPHLCLLLINSWGCERGNVIIALFPAECECRRPLGKVDVVGWVLSGVNHPNNQGWVIL